MLNINYNQYDNEDTNFYICLENNTKKLNFRDANISFCKTAAGKMKKGCLNYRN